MIVVSEVIKGSGLRGDCWPDHERSTGGARLRSNLWELQLLERAMEGDYVLHSGEVGMGGPVFAEYLLRDGAIVDRIQIGHSSDEQSAKYWHDVAGSSLRVVNAGDGPLVYDEERKTLSALAVHCYWEFWAEFHRRQESGEAMAAWLLEFPCQTTQYRAHRGLWLRSDHYVFSNPHKSRLHHQLADGRELAARSLMPDDLRRSMPPASNLYGAPYALYADGVDTLRHVSALDEVFVSAGGDCLALEGVCLRKAHSRSRVWLVRAGRYWQAIHALACIRVDRRREHVELRVVSISDDGTLVLETTRDRGGGEYELVESSSVRLAVEWQERELTVSAQKGRFAIHVPRCER